MEVILVRGAQKNIYDTSGLLNGLPDFRLPLPLLDIRHPSRQPSDSWTSDIHIWTNIRHPHPVIHPHPDVAISTSGFHLVAGGRILYAITVSNHRTIFLILEYLLSTKQSYNTKLFLFYNFGRSSTSRSSEFRWYLSTNCKLRRIHPSFPWSHSRWIHKPSKIHK